MRSIIYIFILMHCLGCANTKNATTNLNKLKGTWVTVKLEMDGTLLPKESFEKQKLILSDSTYTFIAESVDKGIVKYNGDKMDIYGKDGVNAGKHFSAKYKYENEQLTICYNLSGDAYPETFETKGKPMYFLAVFKKEGAK
jgi:uncharacterized protein (TIGR03067 family)